MSERLGNWRRLALSLVSSLGLVACAPEVTSERVEVISPESDPNKIVLGSSACSEALGAFDGIVVINSSEQTFKHFVDGNPNQEPDYNGEIGADEAITNLSEAKTHFCKIND